VRNAKTESRLAIAIGIWIVALGVYSFVLFLAHLGDIRAMYYGYYPPIHLPIVLWVGLVITLLGIRLIGKGISLSSSVGDGSETDPKAERD